jgi:hypothetical protein
MWQYPGTENIAFLQETHNSTIEVSRVHGANSEASPHTLSSNSAISHFSLKMISPLEFP